MDDTQASCENFEAFEQNFSRLKDIVGELESGSISLDRGMSLFQEGMLCSKRCKSMLESARHQLTKWQEGEETPLSSDDVPF
ncbi:MAG: exodeoxyribonuclease VII small subunit [Desulfovibrio sp.]|nr:exodeoxyribonuclease VII small subunit [Desulfovibrio sp.]